MTAFLLKTAPGAEPVSLAEAKDHLRTVSGNDEDALILGLIKTAREQVEQYTGRKLISQVWQLKTDRLSGEVEVLPDVTEIVSVTYRDGDNVEQTLADTVYVLRQRGLFSVLGLQYGQQWPAVLRHPDSVTIEFKVGYGGAEAVPQPIKHAMLLLISHLYEFREVAISGTIMTQVPMSYEYLLNSYRIPVVG